MGISFTAGCLSCYTVHTYTTELSTESNFVRGNGCSSETFFSNFSALDKRGSFVENIMSGNYKGAGAAGTAADTSQKQHENSCTIAAVRGKTWHEMAAANAVQTSAEQDTIHPKL